MHAPPDDQATTASFVAELRADAPPRAWACLGSPCASVYVPVFPPRGARDARAIPRSGSGSPLRDRVEADPDALAAVRAVLAPVEAELWAEADAVDAERHRRTPGTAFAIDAAYAPASTRALTAARRLTTAPTVASN